ncbi:hypothetical protein CPAV1605_1448 [seawater metagenome]|uniref:Alpha/beta hydrolase family n=1 Tax=seawater metagenome TaxID=1561972 RepID=A0A5E8CJV7_9ZZZZ
MYKLLYPIIFLGIVNSLTSKNKYQIITKNKILKEKLEKFMQTEGKEEVSNLFFHVQIIVYTIHYLYLLEQPKTTLLPISYKDDIFHLEYIDTSHKNSKIILYAPGLLETKIDSIIHSQIKYYTKNGYDFCIFWKQGTKDESDVLDLLGNEDHYNLAINNIINRDYEEIYLIGMSAGTYSVLKYLSSPNYKNIVKGGSLLSGSLDLQSNLLSMSIIWQYYFSYRLINIYNLNNKLKIFSKTNLVKVVDNVLDQKYIEDKIYEINNAKCLQAPCLMINSKDDPVIAEYHNKGFFFEDCNNFARIVTKLGGHGTYIKVDMKQINFCSLPVTITDFFFRNCIELN